VLAAAPTSTPQGRALNCRIESPVGGRAPSDAGQKGNVAEIREVEHDFKI
jgi:hypothetical protein